MSMLMLTPLFSRTRRVCCVPTEGALLLLKQWTCLTTIIFGILWCGAPRSYALIQQGVDNELTIKNYIADANKERSLIVSDINVSSITQLESMEMPTSRLGRMAVASRKCQLDPSIGAVDVFKTLPTSDLEMEAFSRFMLAANGVSYKLYVNYYRCAFDNVLHYPEYLKSLFAVTANFNSQEYPDIGSADWFCSELGTIYRLNPEEFDNALKETDPQYRKGPKYCATYHYNSPQGPPE